MFVDLIDTLWNVKLYQAKRLASYNNRFNRYIVECKAIRTTNVTAGRCRFNRYIVECKDGRLKRHNIKFRLDLIDTLWNVKLLQENARYQYHPRFNRYIVECKAGSAAAKYIIAEIDLIDTLWNVKRDLSLPLSLHL